MANNSVLIFDWDDTLIEAGPTICKSQIEAIQIMLKKTTEFPFITKWQLPKINELKLCIGMRFLDTIIPKIFPLIDYSKTEHLIWANELYETFKTIYKKQPKELFPNSLNKLLELDQAGYTLTIATNKSRELFLFEMQKTKIPPSLFKFIVCGDDSIINKNFKPKPDMINLIQNKFATANNFIMIGDSEFDIKAANTANKKCYSIAIKNKTKNKADIYLTSVADINENILQQILC